MLAGLASACDDSSEKKTAAQPSAATPVETAKPKEPEKPKRPPTLVVNEGGPLVNGSPVAVEKNDGEERLAEALAAHKEFLQGKQVEMQLHPKAKLDWVMMMFAELEKQGVEAIEVATESRKSFPQKLKFTPQGKMKDAPGCSLVASVLEDRGTAVWQLSGGTASKRAKGFAGPDLSMTGETIERRGALCKNSTNLFLSASEGIEWGLVYDLGASTHELKKVKLDTFVLLLERPVAGRKVAL